MDFENHFMFFDNGIEDSIFGYINIRNNASMHYLMGTKTKEAEVLENVVVKISNAIGMSVRYNIEWQLQTYDFKRKN